MFYPPGDAKALARVIDRIANEPQTLDMYRKKLPGVQKRVSWSSERKKYVMLLSSLTPGLMNEQQLNATYGSGV
jgi:hypothetical protein